MECVGDTVDWLPEVELVDENLLGSIQQVLSKWNKYLE